MVNRLNRFQNLLPHVVTFPVVLTEERHSKETFIFIYLFILSISLFIISSLISGEIGGLYCEQYIGYGEKLKEHLEGFELIVVTHKMLKLRLIGLKAGLRSKLSIRLLKNCKKIIT